MFFIAGADIKSILSNPDPAEIDRLIGQRTSGRCPDAPSAEGGRGMDPTADAPPIRGVVEVAPELAGSVPEGGVLFLIARAGQGGPPLAVVRVAELRDWIDSGAYDKIMTGEYPRRSDEDLKPYREDLAEAAKGYTDAAQEIFDEVDAAVDKLKTRFTDAWRRGKGD